MGGTIRHDWRGRQIVARDVIQPEAVAGQDILAMLIRFFSAVDEATEEARRHAERDRDYYDGDQWSEAEKAALKARGQAPIVINRIKPKVDFLLGLERVKRTDPKLLHRNPDDQQAAEAATQAVRFVGDANRFDDVRSQVFEHMLIEGTGAVEVVTEGKGEDARVKINLIPWDRLFVDPYARRRDLDDAKYRGQVIWMDLSEAKRRWPGKHDVIEATMNGSGGSGHTFDDKPDPFSDSKRRRVRVIECWWRDGGRMLQAVYVKGGILDGPRESPYRDDDGKPQDPYVIGVAFVTRHGERYGAVRQLVDIQDEINKRRSKALHLLSVRQVRAEQGAVADVDRARRELARPDGFIETTPGMAFEMLPTGDMARAQFELLTEAKSEIDAVGANAALAGKANAGASGRAIQARQQGGQTETGPIFDALRSWQHRVYRKMWSRIKQVWTGPRWLRVTDDPQSAEFIQVNNPVTLEEALTKKFGEVPPELAGHPALSQTVSTDNHLAQLDVDIIVSDVPDTVTLQGERLDKLSELARAGVPIPPELIVAASGLGSDASKQIRDALGQTPEAKQARQQRQKQDQEIKDQGAQAEIKALVAKAERDMAAAQKAAAEAQKIQVETAIESNRPQF